MIAIHVDYGDPVIVACATVIAFVVLLFLLDTWRRWRKRKVRR